MKKYIWFIVAATLALASCNKDNAEGREEGAPSSSNVFYNVVSQLVNKNELEGEYTGQKFQPTIGVPDGGDESVRVVATNSLEAAVNRYNTLTGASIDTNTVTHTFNDSSVGTITWSKNTDNKAFGTVTVNVPSVPALQKIIYRAQDQSDTNGSFGTNGEASAYYRFGDVVKRRREDGVVEYWVCVRPAFTYEEKEKSHWISVSPLPKEHVWEYYKTGRPFTASNGMEYGLPYKIGTDLEWAQDLAEMLFAIMYPKEWAQNIQNHSGINIFGRPTGLPIFNDWHSNRIKYHNEYFWTNVQREWKKNDIVRKVFGISYEEMAAALSQEGQNGRGLHLLYDGHYWSTTFSNKPNLYQVHYGHGTKDVQKNMHQKTVSKPSHQVVVPKSPEPGPDNFPLDVFKLTEAKPYLQEPRFFGDENPRWIIRYAEGAELTSSVYDPMQVISEFQGDNEEYRYYRDVFKKDNLAEKPEETTADQGSAGIDPVSENDISGFFFPGTVIRDEQGVDWVCYTGWFNMPGLAVTKDRKARFITTKGCKTSYDGKGLTFNSLDLPPLNEAISMIYLFATATRPGNTTKYKFVLSIQEYLGVELESRFVERDSLFNYNNASYSSSIVSGSILYMPQGGKEPGTQPYLRYIYDGTWCGEARPYVPAAYKYPNAVFYTHYNDDRKDPMDLAHLLSVSNYVTDQRPVPSDKWSRCEHKTTRRRDGAFTKSMLYESGTVDMSKFLESPLTYKNAYHDPVTIVRYLELDDDSKTFKGTYNGKTYTLIKNAKPSKQDVILSGLTETAFTFSFIHNTQEVPMRCTFNDQPYQLDLFRENTINN